MRTFGFAAIVFAVVLSPCIAKGDTFADAAAARHRAYAGFAAGDGKIVSLTYTDTVTGQKDGVPLEIVRTRRVGVIYRSDTVNIKAKVAYSEGFTGNIFWYSDFNGLTVPVYGDSAKMRIAEDLFFTDAIATLPWQSAGSKTIDGRSFDVFRVRPERTYPIDLYVDRQTGAYGRAVVDPGGERETIFVVLAYAQAASGTNIVSKWSVDGEERNHSLSDITVNTVVSDDRLHPPPPTAQWSFLNGKPFPVKLTEHRILVEAKVNGVQGLFILDSGAQNIIFSGAFARRAGLRAIGHGDMYGMTGAQRLDTGIADSIDVGGNILKNATVYFGSRTFDEDAPDGLMGYDLFGGVIVAVDVEKSTMQISDPAITSPDSMQGIHVRVDLGDGRPKMPFRVEHRAILYAMLDTGSPLIAISSDLLQREGLHFTDDSIYSADGWSGCGVLDSIALGPMTLGRPGACRYLGPQTHDAIVGYEFVRAFAKIYFDYPSATMVFVLPDHPHAPFR